MKRFIAVLLLSSCVTMPTFNGLSEDDAKVLVAQRTPMAEVLARYGRPFQRGSSDGSPGWSATALYVARLPDGYASTLLFFDGDGKTLKYHYSETRR